MEIQTSDWRHIVFSDQVSNEGGHKSTRVPIAYISLKNRTIDHFSSYGRP